MDRRRLPALGTLLAAALLGCGGGWHVVAQASPAPFAGQGRFAVVSVDYAAVRAGGKPEGSSLADDEAALDEKFIQTLRARARLGGIEIVRSEEAGDAPFLIRPSISSLDPGSGSSRVDMDVKIVAPDGRVLDEIQLSHGSDASAGHRLRADGEALGTLVAAYVKERVGHVTTSAASPAPAETAENEDPAPPRPRPRPTPPPPPPEPPPAAEPPPPPPPPLPAQRAKRGAAVKPRKPDPIPAGTPIASSPGFSRLEDGTSRIWVEVTRKVDVAEARTRGRAVYRIRGAALLQATTQLPLPTSFFTTPVDRVQLVAQGGDLYLVVDLREDVAPVYRVVETPRGMVLQVDLPRSAAFQRKPDAPRTDGAPPEPDRPRAKRPVRTQRLGEEPRPEAPAEE